MSIFPYTCPKTGLVFTGAPIAHGEVTIAPIAFIPDAHGDTIPPLDGRHVVGHSESGNSHVLDRVEGVERYRDPSSPDVSDASEVSPVRSFLRIIGDDVRLEQLGRGNHGTQTLVPGDYIVTTGVEYTPEGLRRAAD